MNKMKKIIITAFAFTVFGTGALELKAAYVGGGTWNYGVGITGSYSDYFHGGVRHSSTVKHGDNASKSIAGAGVWSKARLTRYSGCSFYWAHE